MEQKKIGQFIKGLRKEKGITQEQLAEKLGVSGRTVSRWETGNNMPDISLLVEIADYFEVDVRELIEGERKSEKMDSEIRDVATKMANYADEEKGKLLKKIQIISFIGVLVALISTIWQSIFFDMNDYGYRISLFFSVAVLVIMSIITLYVTGLLEKIMSHKRIFMGIKLVAFAGLAYGVIRIIKDFIFLVVVMMFLFVTSVFERPEVHQDIENYKDYMSFGSKPDKSGYNKWSKLSMDESIWPEEITDDMKVEDYKMVHYNPWDAQYVGYLVVDYDSENYAKEVDRLKAYESTEYIGYYSVKEEKTFQLLAMNADAYNGFVYALTDGKSRIIYAEELFCNYHMDLNYKKYIPEEYLLDGFDATSNNPYKKRNVRN